ncbi:MAG: DUF1015 domain-containing protein [Bacteroidia bacterium]|nr:DUF1015 domain-containing protein [Bacteroidia bacterium]
MIEPFEGWVYRGEARVAPVRDALSPSKVEMLRSDPYQALHIAFPQDPTHLPEIWERWIAERVLRREPLPAVYAYSQTFYRYGQKSSSSRRIGVVGLLSASVSLLPHESVLSERLRGIVEALSALSVQATPIHVLAGGEWERIIPLLESYLVCPQFVFGGADGVMHRWTPIHHQGHQRLLREALAQGPFYIADGHHRWKAVQIAGLRYFLVYLTPLRDDTLVIVPTHRLLRSRASLFSILEKYFLLRSSAARIPLWQEIQGLRHAVGIVSPEGQVFVARLRPEYWGALENRPLVALLHEWVLDRVEGEVLFSREAASLIQAALQGEGWAFILPELSFRYVEKAVQEGFVLPPKATYFFPKVLSGMCYYYEGHTGIGISSSEGSA